MGYSYTSTSTNTWTHAQYLASKVAADLRQMQLFYGQPTDEQIDGYRDELAILLAGAYIDYVEYGFLRDGNWVLVLRYTARYDGMLDDDDRPGRVYSGADISGASWASFLVKNERWWSLSAAERNRIEQSLPFRRVPALTPRVGDGVWLDDKSYSRSGMSLTRRTFRPR